MRSGRVIVRTFRSVRSVPCQASTGDEWELPLKREPSVWPSVAELVPAMTPCLCGVGPVARDVSTPQEAVERISLVERTLLLAQFLAEEVR